MQRLKLKITEKEKERFGDTWRFRVRGNGILFEILVPNHELDQAKLEEVNEKFANSLRVIKHTAGYFNDQATDKDGAKILNMLTTTNTGVGIRVKDDPLPEFIRFNTLL